MNPYRTVKLVFALAVWTLVTFVGLIAVSVIGTAMFYGWGFWMFLWVPLALVGFCVVVLGVWCIEDIYGALVRKWRRAEARWDIKHDTEAVD